MTFKTEFSTLTVVMAAVITLCPATNSWAGEGHDHGGISATPSMNGPQRLPDGSVFLPKSAQRQLVIRTIKAEIADLPKSIELNGKVSMDPNAGGKVQAINAGRVEAGPKGLPNLGSAVRKGDVLAYLVSSLAPIEQSNQFAQLAELKAAKSLAEKRLARLRELSDTVPRKDIEAAESDLQSLTGRVSAVSTGLNHREPLAAPVSGVIASSNAVAGQVIDARELVFEIVDPARLRIEALAFDTSLIASVDKAFVAVNNQRIALQFLGAARSLREQALPMNFKAQGEELSALALGEPIRVVIQTKDKVKGMAVPVSALMKNPANQSIVWVKTAAERFTPRTITFEPLDGTRVAVTSGLESGDLIAAQGATLINQVR
jgi:cobalt-zinc-cadmium efflux system membrane fusion protein